MPYYGEPSKSCLECRVKRRRCDLSRPSCSQCIRAKVDCRGYRSKLEVSFKDETRQVIRKARRLPYENVVSDRGSDVRLNSSDTDAENDRSNATNGTGLVVTLAKTSRPNQSPVSQLQSWPSNTSFLNDVATSYMFSRCLVIDNSATTMRLTFLEELYHTAGEGDMLREAVEAIGLLLTSNLAQFPDGVGRAHAKYGRALRLTSAALNDADNAKSDKAIATVLMLQMYETANCSDLSSWETAARHSDGAARLLCLRGPEILENHSGKKLFYLVRTQVVSAFRNREATQTDRIVKLLASYFRRQPVPPSMLAMMRACRKTEGWMESEELLSTLSDLSAICCKIRADIARGFLCYAQALELLLRLDTDIRRSYTTLHRKFPVHKRPLLSGMDAYGAWYNDHPSRIEAMMWMQYHSIRLMVHSSLLEVLPASSPQSWYSSSTDDESEEVMASTFVEPQVSGEEQLRRYSVKAELDSRLEICATIPNIMQVSNLARGLEAMEDVSLPSALTTCWHFYTAAGGERVPAELRDWAVRMLNIMDQKTAVRLAGTLARQLEAEAIGSPPISL